MLDEIVDRGAPAGANRYLADVRSFCNWSVQRGLIEVSPCVGIKPPSPSKSRDRILSDDELLAVWKAAEALGYPFGPLVQLLILTGQRRDEVAHMCWSEIDLDVHGTWTLPRERSKNNQAHILPLSDAAVAILEKMPRFAGSDLVFTTTGRTTVSGFSKTKARLDAAMPKDAPPWVLHDLRRTFASGCARLGISLPVVEKCLNHQSGSFRGIVGVCQRHSFEAEKRHALDSWARHVQALISSGPDNTVAGCDV
jgi:integrase